MIVNPEIEQYLNSLLPPRDEVLAEMESLAAARHIPIIGPAVARILAQQIIISRAKRIFELGSAGAGEGAEVHYSDGRPDNARQAKGYFERAGVASKIHIHVGDALAGLAATPGEFDLIFNDVDKEGYPAVLQAVPPRLKRGGLFITDNTLWHETVLHPTEASDRAVVQFNRQLYDFQQFFTTLLPIRDGLTVSVKLV